MNENLLIAKTKIKYVLCVKWNLKNNAVQLLTNWTFKTIRQ